MKTVWPKTWRGWKSLFWLSIRCCPVHHSPLTRDTPLYDDRRTGYCFACSGIAMLPLGFREALRQNTAAAMKRDEGRDDERSQGARLS